MFFIVGYILIHTIVVIYIRIIVHCHLYNEQFCAVLEYCCNWRSEVPTVQSGTHTLSGTQSVITHSLSLTHTRVGALDAGQRARNACCQWQQAMAKRSNIIAAEWMYHLLFYCLDDLFHYMDCVAQQQKILVLSNILKQSSHCHFKKLGKF